MALYWGTDTGERPGQTMHRLANRLRLVRVGQHAAVRTMLRAMDGETRGSTNLTGEEAGILAGALRRAAARMWWSPGFAQLTRILANDADRAARAGTWVID